MKTFHIMAILSIIIAIAAPLALAVKSQQDVKSADIVRIKITTYDPRDLLYGHYMTYRYDWNWNGKTSEGYYPKSCLCVGEGSVDPKVTLMTICPLPGKAPHCAHVVKGSYRGSGNFDPGNTRYYVDETIAKPLEKLFQQQGRAETTLAPQTGQPEEPSKPAQETFRIGLGLLANGRTVIEKLYIGDDTLEQYIDKHKDDFAPAPKAKAR